MIMRNGEPMAIATEVNVTAGTPGEQVQLLDQNGAPIPNTDASWATRGDPNVTITANADGQTFAIAAAAGTPDEDVTTMATYTGPRGGNGQTPEITIHVHAQAQNQVTSMQMDDIGPMPAQGLRGVVRRRAA